MRILKMKMNDYKLFNFFEVNFYKSKQSYYGNMNISIIVGENGTGKTTLMKAIAEKFCPENFKDDEDCKKDFEIQYEMEGEELDTQNIEGDLHPRKVITSSYAVFDKYEPIPKWIMNRKEGCIENKTKYSYCGPIDNRYGSRDLVIEYIVKIIGSFNDEKLKKFGGIIEKIGYKGVLGVEIDKRILREEKNRLRRKLKSYNTTNEEYIMIDQNLDGFEKMYADDILNNRRKMKVGSTKKGMTVFNIYEFVEKFYEGYRGVIDNDFRSGIKDIHFVDNFGNLIKLSEMSSGEITMLFRFLPLIIEVEDNSIVIIDEPETHLHPKWIREFIEYLKYLFEDKNIHVIIATHSPGIVSDVPRESIIGLIKNETGIKQYMPLDKTIGARSTELLEDVFGLEKRTSQIADYIRKIVDEVLEKEGVDTGDIKKAIDMYHDLGTNLEKYELFRKHKEILESGYVDD